MAHEVGKLFDAQAENVWGVFNCHNSVGGYQVPIYQRTYDWNEEKIARLFEDCITGLTSLSISKESHTFLGTLILVADKEKESTFDGFSMSIVDGQQRLTTLLLIIACLYNSIYLRKKQLNSLPNGIKEWFAQEFEFQLNSLYDCLLGKSSGRGETHPFPRLIRHKDNRGKNPKEADYKSLISNFLDQFSKWAATGNTDFNYNPNKNDAETERFISNYNYISKVIEFIAKPSQKEAEELELDFPTIDISHLSRAGMKTLFEKVNFFENDSLQDSALAQLSKEDECFELTRLIMFTSYLTSCVVLTRVETDNSDYAFDIFDALNTTGEPLTAIETFKPLVIKLEQQNDGYEGSDVEDRFSEIEAFINQHSKPEDRQKEAKELIVAFALYLMGKKQSLNLGDQRKFLRSNFNKLTGKNAVAQKRKFITSLADVANYKSQYWAEDGIADLRSVHGTDANQMRLCLQFIKDMKMSLVNPILARYYANYVATNNDRDFVSAVRAITAFIVLRRGATGSTLGIDSDLRTIMEKGKGSVKDSKGLCTGLLHENDMVPINELKTYLRAYLSEKKIGIKDKNTWVSQVVVQPLANYSTTLCRFIILAAAHNAKVADSGNGKWTRDDFLPSKKDEYLTYDMWKFEEYLTVEHVAPVSDPDIDWDKNIYVQPYLKQTIGNLTLLPKQQNSSIGNATWAKKRIFYQALTAKDSKVQKYCYEKADKSGFKFKKSTVQILAEGTRLDLLEPVHLVKSWDVNVINARSENMASLTWDLISSWIYD